MNQKTHPTRAETRHESARAKARAARIAKLQFFSDLYGSEQNREENQKVFTQKHWQNRKRCSCQMCRNPRHSIHYKGAEKLTMQERKAQAAEIEV